MSSTSPRKARVVRSSLTRVGTRRGPWPPEPRRGCSRATCRRAAKEAAQAQTREEPAGAEAREERMAGKRANRAAQPAKRRADPDEVERAAAVLPEAPPPRPAETLPAKPATAVVTDQHASRQMLAAVALPAADRSEVRWSLRWCSRRLLFVDGSGVARLHPYPPSKSESVVVGRMSSAKSQRSAPRMK